MKLFTAILVCIILSLSGVIVYDHIKAAQCNSSCCCSDGCSCEDGCKCDKTGTAPAMTEDAKKKCTKACKCDKCKDGCTCKKDDKKCSDVCKCVK